MKLVTLTRVMQMCIIMLAKPARISQGRTRNLKRGVPELEWWFAHG